MHLEDCCGAHVGGDQGLDCEAGVRGAEMRRKRGDTSSGPAVWHEPLPGRRCGVHERPVASDPRALGHWGGERWEAGNGQ